MSKQDINVEEIMSQIRASIAEREIHNEKIHFDVVEQGDFNGRVTGESACDIGDLKASITLVKKEAALDAEWHIKSHRKIIGPFLVMFKRIIRKLSYEYMSVMAEKQSRFNKDAAICLSQLYEYTNGQTDVSERVDNLEKEVKGSLYKEMVILEERNRKLEEENKQLKEALSDLEYKQDSDKRTLEIITQKLELLELKCEKLEAK